MGPTLKTTLMAAGLAVGLGLTSTTVTAAQGDTVGDTQMCVRSRLISSQQVIDDKTILLTMIGRDEFKRIDLVNRCAGLRMANGFSYSPTAGELCTTDPLRVIQPVGATCMIKQIVTISPEEAKDLKAKRYGKSKDSEKAKKEDEQAPDQDASSSPEKG